MQKLLQWIDEQDANFSLLESHSHTSKLRYIHLFLNQIFIMQQVSVFAENQRGMMEKITGVLRSEDINILGSVTNDSAEYGIVRMVVSNPSAAVDALTKAGLLCHLTEVVGVELMDEVGNLNQLLQALSESNINVNYLYLSFNRETGMPIMVFHSEDIMEVKACIERKGYTVL